MSDKLNILCIGGPEGKMMAEQAYPEDNVEYQRKLTVRKIGHYDHIISYHELQLHGQREAEKYLRTLSRALKVDGTLTLFVPDLEWVAEQILSEDPSPVTLLQVFGNQMKADQYFKSGYTLRLLRKTFALAGFAVTHANYGFYQVEWLLDSGDKVAEDVGQLVVIARKRPEEEDAPYQKTKE